MEEISKNIWVLRREEEDRIGHSIPIYSAYHLIGRGSVIHKMPSHEEVEKRFEKALSFSFKERICFWIKGLLLNKSND